MAALDKLGNGTGYIYITEVDGSTIVSNLNNTTAGREAALLDGLTSAPIAGERLAQSALTITVAGGTIDNITINAVSIFDVTVPIVGATTAIQAANTVTAINAYVSVPDYTAFAVGNIVYINPMPGTGSTVNGFAGAVMVTGPTAATITDMGGGAPATGIWDAVLGRRYFLDATSAAVEGVVSGTEISRFIINRGQQASAIRQDKSILNGIVTIDRDSNYMTVDIETEGMAATDDLRTIVETNGNFQNGDIIVFRGKTTGDVVTFKEYAGGSDNIKLLSGIDFSTGDPTRQITLQYLIVGGAVTAWREISRSAPFPTVVNQRASSVATPVQGINSAAMPTNGTVTFSPGTDKGSQRVTGSPVLIAPVAYVAGGTPMQGDEFILDYEATPTLAGNTVTIFGILLTTTQATSGRVRVGTKYDGAVWRPYITIDVETFDVATVTQVNAQEPGLGNPAADGYVLSSTAAGARSWIANANDQVLYNVTANNQTTAVITTEILKTYTLNPAISPMDINGDELMIMAVYQTAANGNAKTISIAFGATDVITLTGNYNAQTIVVSGTINRITSSTQSSVFRASVSDTATGGGASENFLYSSALVENLGVSVVINIKATNGVANAGDIISRQASVKINKFRS